MSLQHPGAAFEKAQDPLSGCLVFPGDGHLKPCLSCMALAQLALAHSEPALCINNMQIQQLEDCGIEVSGGMSATLNVLLMAVHDKRAHIRAACCTRYSTRAPHPQTQDGLCVHARLLLLPFWTAGSPAPAHTTIQQRLWHRHNSHCMLPMRRTFLRPGVWLNLYGTRSGSGRALAG